MDQCTVQNIVAESMRDYIDPNELLRKLKRLYPRVTSVQAFRLNVRVSTVVRSAKGGMFDLKG